MSDYGAVSFVVMAIGVGTWLSTWQATTRLLPRNRRRSAAYPGFYRSVLLAKRIGFWVFVLGLSNLVLAVILIQMTS